MNIYEIATALGLSFAIAMAGWATAARTAATLRERLARQRMLTYAARQEKGCQHPPANKWEAVAADMEAQRDRAVALSEQLLAELGNTRQVRP